jgi:uncharacterized membrane protein YphA (DoxX/SURF4 family)
LSKRKSWLDSSKPRIGAKLNEVNTQVYWPPWTRIVFRFVFSYLVLYCLYVFAWIVQIVKGTFTGRSTDTYYDLLCHHIVPWVGSHILRLPTPITVFTGGSGDTTYDNVLILCELFLAVVATILWSMLDRNRTEYRRVHQWLRFVVRLVLSSQMLIYGMDKLIPQQFGRLALLTLGTRVGDLTPFDLLWTFMAASKPYTIICGAAEVLAGLLLVFPGLTTLGALIAMADMANVFALDMSYDVPVKLGALHYLLMALFLVAPEMRRLMNVFIFNRPAAPREQVPLSNRRWVNRSAQIFLVLAAIFWLSKFTHESLTRYASENHPVTAPRPALYGIWQVEEFAAARNSSAPLFTAKLASELRIGPGDDRWMELIVDSAHAGIRLSNGVLAYVTLKLDMNKNTVLIGDDADEDWKCDFVYQQTGDRQLTLEGHINGNAATIKLRRVDRSKWILVTRGFHWINEDVFR